MAIPALKMLIAVVKSREGVSLRPPMALVTINAAFVWYNAID